MDDLDDVFDYFEHYEEELNDQRIPKRYIRDAENPLEFFAESEFERRYRFTKDLTVNVILPLVAEQLKKPNNRGLPFSPLLQLLITLRFFSTSSFQAVCGDLRGASQQSVCNIIKRCSILLAEKCGEYVRFPADIVKQRMNISKFANYAGFPTVSGCVDGTHIRISNPGGENAEVFRNRKGYFSLNVQVVAGPSMEILDIVVRHPGSTYDSVIFDRSGVRVRFKSGQVKGVLLGDSDYPCRTYLLTPVLHPATEPERRYNIAHIRTRNMVERVFGMWKRKFPCLQKGFTIKLDTTVAIICATAVLYNIAVQHNEIEEEDLENVHDDLHNNVGNENIGLAFRRQFIVRHFS